MSQQADSNPGSQDHKSDALTTRLPTGAAKLMDNLCFEMWFLSIDYKKTLNFKKLKTKIRNIFCVVSSPLSLKINIHIH